MGEKSRQRSVGPGEGDREDKPAAQERAGQRREQTGTVVDAEEPIA